MKVYKLGHFYCQPFYKVLTQIENIMKTTLVHSGSSSSLVSFSSSVPSVPGETNLNPNPDNSIDDDDSFEKPSQAKKCDGCIKRVLRRKNFERIFPILRWAPLYDVNKLVSDIIAGLTVGLTVLPQGLAYATVAGLPPIYGLYSSFVGCFVYIVFGGTKAITIGPTAIQSILTSKYTEGKPPEYAVFLCFITAVVTLFMGIFNLGFVANFISSPVISAFTSGVALTIVATQLKSLLGLNFHKEGFLPTLEGLADHIGETKKWDAILSLVCCSFLLCFKYLQTIFSFIGKKSPKIDKLLWLISVAKSAIVIVACTVLVGCWYPDQPFSIVGHITPGLPEFKPPPFEIFDVADNQTHYLPDLLREQASALIVLPLLGVMGHITIAKVFAGTDRVDATQEILVIGISNAISCFFSSMPIGGSFSRTTVNAQSGVQTPAGGLLTGIMVILALQFLTPYFFFIPKASLASVICVSCIFMVDFTILLPLWRSKKMDLVPWALTFLVTLFVGLEFGILTGLLISTLFLLYYSARPRVKVLKGETTNGSEFVLIQLDRSLTFPSVDYITYEMSKAASKWADARTPIVVDCHHIQFADFTAAEGVRDMIINLNQLNYKVIFWKVKPSILRVINGVMVNSGICFLHCENEQQVEAIIDGIQTHLRKFSNTSTTIITPNDLQSPSAG